MLKLIIVGWQREFCGRLKQLIPRNINFDHGNLCMCRKCMNKVDSLKVIFLLVCGSATF